MRKAKYDVFLDEKSTNPGEPWADSIDSYLLRCNGAVIFLDEKAIKDSPWVKYESTILRFRRYKDPEFNLQIYPLDESVEAFLNSSQEWVPLRLNRIQYNEKSNNSKEIYKNLIKNFKNLPTYKEQTKIEEIEDHIVNYFKLIIVCNTLIEKVIYSLEINGKFTKQLDNYYDDKYKELARKIICGGILKFHIVLEKFNYEFRRDISGAETLFKSVASSWVDVEKSSRIPEIVERNGLFLLNCQDETFTIKAYINNAYLEYLCMEQRVIFISYKFGRNNIIGEIRNGIKKRFRGVVDKYKTDYEINKALKDEIDDYSYPIFLALTKNYLVDSQLIDEIKNVFSNLTIIVSNNDDIETLRQEHTCFLAETNSEIENASNNKVRSCIDKICELGRHSIKYENLHEDYL